MKPSLRFRLAILCLAILPFISIAQKQPVVEKITAKGNINFKVQAAKQATVLSSREEQVVLQKLNQRLILSEKLSKNSMLLPQRVSGANASNRLNDVEGIQTDSPVPINAFRGVKGNDSIYPADPGGAAGPNYIMHVNNLQYAIHDKFGSAALSLSPDDFWSVFSGTAEAFAYPHVVYDPVLKHFYIMSLGIDLSTNDYAILFGASETDDPTGNWILYELDLGAEFLQDAPQLGYSTRWFTISTQQFDTTAPYNFNSSGVYIMSINNVIKGNLSNIFSLNDPNFFSMSPVETLDSKITNHYLISSLGSSTDSGYLYVVHIGGTLTAPVYKYDGNVINSKPWNEKIVNAKQKGSTKKIFPGTTKLTNAVYRNGQIWTSQTVYLPANKPTRAAVQWWQIKVSTRGITQFGRIEDSQNNDVMYGYPSLSVNKHNDMLIGYTQFSSTTYASAAYSYRNANDALNKLRTSKVYKLGKSAYYAGGSAGVTYNWGAYSATCVDPADSSFWTIQEYAESPENTWGTWWAHVGNVTFAATKPVAQINTGYKSVMNISPNPADAFTTITWNEDKAVNVKIQLNNAVGNTVFTKEFSAQKGSNKFIVNIANLISGIYSVSVYNGINVKTAQLIVE